MAYNPLQSLNVMVVEDQDVAQAMLARVLKTMGVEQIVTAANGVEALSVLENAEPMIDLVICDINMPEMDGYEFVRRVRLGAVQGYQEVPILMLTGDDSDANVQSAKVHKIDSFIVKPANADTLRGQMLNALGLQLLSQERPHGGAVRRD